MPPFDLQGGMVLAAVRGATVAAFLSVFGTLAFRVLVAPRALPRMAEADAEQLKTRLLFLTQGSAGVGFAALAVWLFVQSAVFADADTAGGAFAAIVPVLGRTFFGHVVAAQAAVLLAVSAILGVRDDIRRQRAGFAAAALLLALQAGHSHAWSMAAGVSVLLGADILHLLGAGAWLGGLAPLLLTVAAAPPKAGALAARHFSPLGKACIAALLLSAALQAWVLVASIPGLVGTAYGWLVFVKTALFAVLLGFAAANRYRFAPALLRAGEPVQARRTLIRSITLQTSAALAIVLAAAVLSGLPPAMHEQPLWPLAERWSTAAINEDPDFRREVLVAAAAFGGALLLLAAAVWRRRYRLPAAAIAIVTAYFAVPHFDLLLVPAYPTSFFRSPTGFASDSIVGGQPIYAANCTGCHGSHGAGDGANAKTLPVSPADLTAAHLWMHDDGELFWWIKHGIANSEGAQAMPGFGGLLDADQIWAVIDFIRAQNAGATMARTGRFPEPLRAPGWTAECGADDVRLADLRGKFVHLLIGKLPASVDESGVVTVVAGSPERRSTPPGVCTIGDETVSQAYAILAGLDPAAIVGAEFLIDGAGLLRAMQSPGARPGWTTPAALESAVAVLRAHPAAAADAMPAGMDMKGMNMKAEMKM